MLFCPNCDNILDISKNPPKHKQTTLKQEIDTPATVSDSDNESSDSGSDKEEINDIKGEPDVDKINEIIVKLADDKKVPDGEISDYKLEQFTKHKTYQKLDKKTKSSVLIKLTSFFDKIDDATSAYYFCKNCMYSKAIDPATLISSRISSGTSTEHTNPDRLKNRIHSKILPFTKNYICTNDKCPSHKDMKQKEAVFFRIGGSMQVWYACRACESYWEGE